jgi:hypothetical protein
MNGKVTLFPLLLTSSFEDINKISFLFGNCPKVWGPDKLANQREKKYLKPLIQIVFWLYLETKLMLDNSEERHYRIE